MRTVAQRYGKIFVVAVIVLAGACTSGLIVAWTRADSEIPQDTSSDYPDAGSGAGDHYDADSNVPLPNLSSSVPSRNVTEVVAARDFDHRLWRLEKEIEIADPGTGRKKIKRLVSKIVEVGCGICYRDAAGNWQATDTTWRQTRDGFFMNTANYQVVIGKTAGSWLNYTVDESVMQLRPAALKADDGVYLEDIATLVPDIKGVIDPNDPSRLVFAGAFGTRIDLELQLKPDGFHQNVIFHDEPNLPSYFDENVTDIRLYTELNLDDYVQNQNVAIVIGNQELIGPQPQLNTKPVLDHIEFVKVVEEYDKLVGYDRH